MTTKRNSITASSGYAWETIRVGQSTLYLVIVEANTSSTVFDVILENSYGDEVFKAEDITGTLTESMEIPFAKDGTIKVDNATNDEDFVYSLTVRQD